MGFDWTEETISWIISVLPSSVMETRRLPDDLRNLRNTLAVSIALINKAECWHFKDENLAQILRELKDETYDAEDLLDKFAYCELQRKLAGSQASEALLYACSFIKDLVCHTPYQVKSLEEKLVGLADRLNALISHLDLDDGHDKLGLSEVNVTGSSFVSECKVFGREEDLEKVVEQLCPQGVRDNDGVQTKRRRGENVNVVSIVGMGGVGKTTLAQLVYRDLRVRRFFEMRIWVHVSEEFNVTRLTKEIVECAVRPNQFDGSNFNHLQEVLNHMVRTKKFFLVLDNVWNEDIKLWDMLLEPMMNGKEGSMILVTTRSCDIANMVSTVDPPIFLEGLKEEVYGEFFKNCAFGNFEKPNDYPELQQIAERISSRLKGSPLAARTLGGMLRSHMDRRSWLSVMNSELWELLQKENDILPVLQLSYQCLPAHLKKCFSFCSIFPKGHEFDKNVLINHWVAQGFVKSQGNKQPEDVGVDYLNYLISISFFEPIPFEGTPNHYVIHDLMHDLARFVSMDENFCLYNSKGKNMISNTVRHLSVCSDKIEQENLIALCSYKKIRSLIILKQVHNDLSSLLATWLNKFQNLRCLSLDCCEITILPASIGDLQHLRYLDLSRAGITKLPKSIYRLYNLQFLFLSSDPESELILTGDEFPQGFANLVNLRLLYPVGILSKIPEIRKLSSLQYLTKFSVLQLTSEKGNIGELKDLRQLRGSLRINRLENVTKKEEAIEASLNNKDYLEKLALEWSPIPDQNDQGVVLDSLQPPMGIKEVEINNFRGIEPPSWLNAEIIPYLDSLYFRNCISLAKLPNLPHSIKTLYLENLNMINFISVSLDNCRSPNMESVHIENCGKLISLFPEGFENFTSLLVLVIKDCPKLVYDAEREILLPPSVIKCELNSCGELDKWIPKCLTNLTNLTTLKLRGCKNVTCLSFEEMQNLKELQFLTIHSCEMLSCIEGVLFLSSLKYLEILECPLLTRIEGHVEHAQNVGEQILQKLEHLVIDNTSIPNMHPPALLSLEICNSFDISIPDEFQRWLTSVNSLEKLCFRNCAKLVQLPKELHKLRITKLHIFECPIISSLPDDSLPVSLKEIHLKRCSIELGELMKDYLTRRDLFASHTLSETS